MQVQLIRLLLISSVQYESTVLYVHPALLVTEDMSAQNLLCQTLQTKKKVFPGPKKMLLLLKNSLNY